MSALGIPVGVEKSDISSNLNSSILLAYGSGMYTVIYFGTMYIYLTRSASKSRIVPATITMLFLCNIVETGVQWYVTKWQFINNGDTRDSVFLSSFNIPHWVYIVFNIFSYISFVLADGLLIWRCFFVWNHSLRIILVPLLLVITEAALFFVQTVFQGIYGNLLPPTLATRLNDLQSAAYFTSFAASLITTILIAYRIYSTSKQEGISRQRFKRIIDIVIQSGAVYSLALLVTAISDVSGTNVVSDTPSIALSFYAITLVNVIAGISPTILVARVSMLSPDTTFPSTSVHLSGLQFYAQSNQTAPPQGMEAAQSLNVDSNEFVEGQEIAAKVQ